MSESPHSYRPIAGSPRAAPPDARRVGAADPNAPVEITVLLRRRSEAVRPDPGRPLDRAEFAARLGADPADVARLEDFVHEHGLSVTGVNLAARSVGLAGTVAQMNAAFQVNLGHYERDGETFRGRAGEVQGPAGLGPALIAGLGLADPR